MKIMNHKNEPIRVSIRADRDKYYKLRKQLIERGESVAQWFARMIDESLDNMS